MGSFRNGSARGTGMGDDRKKIYGYDVEFLEYKKADPQWVGKVVRLKGDAGCHAMITWASGSEDLFPVHIDSVPTSLSEFAEKYEWDNGLPCGTWTISKSDADAVQTHEDCRGDVRWRYSDSL